MAKELKMQISAKFSAWDRAYIIAGAAWRAALNRPYEDWVRQEVDKRIQVKLNG